MYAHDPDLRDRLNHVLEQAGSFVTAYFDVSDRTPSRQWAEQRSGVAVHDLPAALEAIDAAVARDVDEHTAGWAVVAAENGTSVVVESPDPPRRAVVTVGGLPYLAPILEWRQRDVPHFVAVLASDSSSEEFGDVEILPFSVTAITDPIIASGAECASLVSDLAAKHDVPLVMVVGPEAAARDLGVRLRERAPIETRVDVLGQPETDLAALADRIVRTAASEGAAETVDRIREFRFERAHENIVEGASETLDAVASGSTRLLLVHDDPSDSRVVEPVISEHPVRLVDAAIAAALVRGIDVRVMPSIANGPRESLGAILLPEPLPALLRPSAPIGTETLELDEPKAPQLLSA